MMEEKKKAEEEKRKRAEELQQKLEEERKQAEQQRQEQYQRDKASTEEHTPARSAVAQGTIEETSIVAGMSLHLIIPSLFSLSLVDNVHFFLSFNL
jgi:hypothetical protein